MVLISHCRPGQQSSRSHPVPHKPFICHSAHWSPRCADHRSINHIIYFMVIYATLMKINIMQPVFIPFLLKAYGGVDMYLNSFVTLAIDVGERTTSRLHHSIYRKGSRNILNTEAGWLQSRYERK